MNYRIEKDTMGEIKVENDKLWGAQTQRSLENFRIGIEKMPLEIIRAFAIIKKASAITNYNLNQLTLEKKEAICNASDLILSGKYDDQFPLVVWQTGSGTQSNMNINEVIAMIANTELGKKVIHPNDDVNKSQSSNDTFPTAMHISAVIELENRLIPALHELKKTLEEKIEKFSKIIKVGRTHLQDATPLTLGQEISGWHRMLEKCENMILTSTEELKELALGGTAVGTGLNAHEDFGEKVASEISKLTGKHFRTARNKFHALTSKDELVFAHGALKALSGDLMKMANDIRWLASGPRCGIGEISIPENEPGSSIMPGKVNPTQCEAMTMVACQIMGNDVAVGIAASQGNFQLNVFMPVCIYNFLQSTRLLTDAILSFNRKCVAGIEPNQEKISEYLNKSLMLVTALNPYIGYDNSAKVAKKAYQEGISLKEAAVKLGLLTEKKFDECIKLEEMV
ncbi:MAG: class II fumarate hydratase [Peptostreptococcales bacterium]